VQLLLGDILLLIFILINCSIWGILWLQLTTRYVWVRPEVKQSNALEMVFSIQLGKNLFTRALLVMKAFGAVERM